MPKKKKIKKKPIKKKPIKKKPIKRKRRGLQPYKKKV